MSFQSNLLSWFRQNARPLPWRKHYRPYEVWVSEIMLQQTQMDTVLPYFERWMKLFPTIESLAKSDEKKVLKAWEGLGYYSRARNLHHTAKLLAEKHGGNFPEDHETILSLKGVGRYTAGAISSIAFNREKPIVDGNVLRVLSRVYAIKLPIDVEKNKEAFWKLEESLIPKGQARYFNQALMELGALVCSTQNPSCLICPIKNFCKAYKQDRAENFPVRMKRKKMVKVRATAIVLVSNGKYLIQKRPLGKIMGGLWEFPEWKTTESKALKFLKKYFGVSGKPAYLKDIKRNYTHHQETLRVFLLDLQGASPSEDPKNGWEHTWIRPVSFKKYPFSSAHAKIAEILRDSP